MDTNFKQWWENSFDKEFVGEDRTSWLPIMKEIAWLAYKAGGKSMLKELTLPKEELLNTIGRI